jgi:hypothetical protein
MRAISCGIDAEPLESWDGKGVIPGDSQEVIAAAALPASRWWLLQGVNHIISLAGWGELDGTKYQAAAAARGVRVTAGVGTGSAATAGARELHSSSARTSVCCFQYWHHWHSRDVQLLGRWRLVSHRARGQLPARLHLGGSDHEDGAFWVMRRLHLIMFLWRSP